MSRGRELQALLPLSIQLRKYPPWQYVVTRRHVFSRSPRLSYSCIIGRHIIASIEQHIQHAGPTLTFPTRYGTTMKFLTLRTVHSHGHWWYARRRGTVVEVDKGLHIQHWPAVIPCLIIGLSTSRGPNVDLSPPPCEFPALASARSPWTGWDWSG